MTQSDQQMIEEIREENTRLRAALAQSPGACIYCQLSKEDWAKCQHGFPGCDRGDDAMGCPELGARMQLEDEAEASLAQARALQAEMLGALKAIENHELRDHEDYEAIQDIASAAIAAIAKAQAAGIKANPAPSPVPTMQEALSIVGAYATEMAEEQVRHEIMSPEFKSACAKETAANAIAARLRKRLNQYEAGSKET